jgi:hypothetical protein
MDIVKDSARCNLCKQDREKSMRTHKVASLGCEGQDWPAEASSYYQLGSQGLHPTGATGCENQPMGSPASMVKEYACMRRCKTQIKCPRTKKRQNNLQMAQKEEGEVGEEEEEVRRPYQVHQLHATSANPILEGKVHKLKKEDIDHGIMCFKQELTANSWS